jgi:energy-coupling factor transporter ATP-binding protein EcfA2
MRRRGARRQAGLTLVEGCWPNVARRVRDRCTAGLSGLSGSVSTPRRRPRIPTRCKGTDRTPIGRSSRARRPDGQHRPMSTALPDLRLLVDRLAELADRRLEIGPASDAARNRAIQLRDHVAGHLRTRSESLDAPVVVLLLGPTGAGKSTLFNTIAGRALSATGVLRPTTREAVVLAHPDDRAEIDRGALRAIPRERMQAASDAQVPRGLVLVDAPDIDSIEHANRELADRLVEAADLAIFVTTATRYADRVPWLVLERVRERGLPLVVVVNRLPTVGSDRAEVLDDVRRLLRDAGFDAPEQAGGERTYVEIVGVDEGRLAPDGTSLDRAGVARVLDRIEVLRSDLESRRALAARALAGAIGGVGPLVERIADDVAHEAIDAASLRRSVAETYGREAADLREELRRGRFLRDEALRHWQAYVGADDITRLFSRGIGAIRGAVMSVFRPTTAPIAEVRQATADDLVTIARLHANEAARRTATAWADEPRVAAAIAERPDLWAASADFDRRLRERLDEWIASIVQDIAATGEGKRRLARGASVGVNAIGVGVMLATFIHTAGLTGAEVGIAAGTAFLNQKLLGAFFGEAAMVELIGRARARLEESLGRTFDEERARFEALVAAPEALDRLVADLRAAAEDARAAAERLGGLEPAGRGTA